MQAPYACDWTVQERARLVSGHEDQRTVVEEYLTDYHPTRYVLCINWRTGVVAMGGAAHLLAARGCTTGLQLQLDYYSVQVAPFP